MSANIFVSYASKDVKVAMTLCNALENRGFMTWIAARDIQPGENFQVAIVQAIRKAKILLLVFTGASNTSEEMTKELALASQQKMIVIPLRIEDVAPSDAFAYEFATRQWIDFFADWEFAIEQLTRRIGQALLERSAGIETNQAADAIAEVIAAENAEEVAPDPASLATASPEPVKAPEPKPDPIKAEAAARLAKVELPPVEPPKAEPIKAEPVKAEPVKAPEPVKPAPAAQAKVAPLAAAANDKPKPNPASQAPPKKSNAKLFAIIAALVVLTGVGLAGTAIMRSGGKPAEEAKLAPVAPAPAALPAAAVVPPPPPVAAATPAESAPTAAATNTMAKPAAAPPKKKAAAPKKEAAPKIDIPF